MSQFSVKATFDGKELVQGFKDVKKEVEGLETAGKGAKQSLDKMLQQKNAGSNYRKQLMQITKELTDLTVNYRRLSDEEKKSEFGVALAQRINELTAKASEFKDAMLDVQQSISESASDTANWDAFQQLIDISTSSLQTFAGVAGLSEDSVEGLTRTIAVMQTIGAASNTVIKIGNALQKQSALMLGVRRTQELAAATAIKLKTNAEVKSKAATVAATVAQKALNAAANANPYVLLASALIAVGAAIWKFSQKSSEAEKAQEEYNKKVKEAEEREKSRRETVNKSIGDVIGKYKLLQTEWKNLTSIQEKNKWITDNKDKFNELGLSINNITSAQDAFINKSDLVIRSLTAQAEAAALAAIYQEAYADAYNRNRELDKSLETVKYKSGYDPTDAEEREAGLTRSDFQTYTYTQTSTYGSTGTTVTSLTSNVNESGARKLENMRKKRIEEEKKANDAEVESILNDLLAKKISAQEAQAELAQLAKKTPTISSTTSSTTSAIVPEVFNENSLKYAQQQVSELQDKLNRMDVNSPDFEATLQSLHEWQDKVTEIQNKMKKPTESTVEVKVETKVVEPPKTVMDIYSDLQKQLGDILAQYDAGAIGRDKATELIDGINSQISSMGLKPIQVNLDLENFQKQLDNANSMFNAMGAIGNVVSGIDSIYESFKNLPTAMEEAENGWERFMVGFEAGMQIMNVMTTTLSTINTLMTTFTMIQELATALKVKDTAATGAKVAADTAEATSAGIAATAETAQAVSGAAKAVSWLPIVGPVLAVAAIAAVIGGIMAARSKGKYASGGIVPGASKIGDFNIAQVNGGEMILNTRQQANLFNMLDHNRVNNQSSAPQNVSFRIQGDSLVGVIDNYNKKRGRL